MNFIELEQSGESVKLLVSDAEPWMSQTWWEMREDKGCIEDKMMSLCTTGFELNKNTLELKNKTQQLWLQGSTS